MAKVGKTRSYTSVLLPSSASLIGYIFFSGIVLVIQNFYALQVLIYTPSEQQAHYDFWHSFNVRITDALNISGVSAFTLYAFWAVIGVIVYMIIHFVLSKIKELDDDINLRSYIWPNARLRNRPLQQFFELALFRLVIFVVLFFYIKFLANFMFQPLARIWPDNEWLNNHILAKCVLVYLLLVVLLHGLIILLRLLLLRKRLLSST